MTLAELIHKAEQTWQRIVAEHRQELIRLCMANGASKRELEMVLAEHDRLEREFIAEKREELIAEFAVPTRRTLH